MLPGWHCWWRCTAPVWYVEGGGAMQDVSWQAFWECGWWGASSADLVPAPLPWRRFRPPACATVCVNVLNPVLELASSALTVALSVAVEAAAGAPKLTERECPGAGRASYVVIILAAIIALVRSAMHADCWSRSVLNIAWSFL